jgi:hypothetical protein
LITTATSSPALGPSSTRRLALASANLAMSA